MLSIGTTYLDGAPRVVLALRDAEDLTEVARFASRGVDVLEARIDQFTQTDAAYVQGYLARLRPFPLLGTIRYAAEGGGWKASEAEREALFRAILPSVDAVNVLRIQLERDASRLFPSLREYHNFYGITRKRLEKAGRAITILHPGPINRDVEISADVADSEHSVILQQVLNGVAIRMAVLYLLSAKN